jgi:hypothetical protein
MAAELLIGSRGAEHLAIEVLRREGAGETDFWDGNWVIALITLSAGGFTGRVTASLRMDEFHRLNEGLKFIRDNLFGTAVLESMEDWISLEIKCDDAGRLFVSGELGDQSSVANRLSFELPEKDQSYLGQWIAELDAMEREYPVVGRP